MYPGGAKKVTPWNQGFVGGRCIQGVTLLIQGDGLPAAGRGVGDPSNTGVRGELVYPGGDTLKGDHLPAAGRTYRFLFDI